MEFAEFRVLGGAGALANLVKSFAGAGIVNRVIAIFDNDAAASAAVKSLEKITLPRHIVLLRLPHFEFLSAYPTLGPTGPSTMDINGMAASIELYLGEDVLRDKRGILSPVQWTGYEGLVGAYQGEILSKADIQERFIRKIERARADRDFLSAADWTGIRHILTAIFSAFHRLNCEALSKQLSYYYEDQIDI
jgi:hypothetical protein